MPTAEPQYYISAYDAFDGRIIWQVPVGAGYPNTHEYGGIYFDRLDENGRTSKSLYVGTNRHLVKVTSDEWREFQEHFHTRKLELGDCARPYGTPCQHEHSCLRCPMLRVSPKQRPRLIEIIRNLAERIAEARTNGWLGEVQGLQVNLTKAKEKLVALDRSMARSRSTGQGGPTDLGMPVITRAR